MTHPVHCPFLVFSAALLCVSEPAFAKDTELTRLGDSCGEFKILPCVTTLFTDHPFHIAVSSLAPGNGFAAGPALSFTHHTKPKHIPGPNGDTETNWRFAWDTDAVASNNLSWRAGFYMKARYTKIPPTIVVPGAGSPANADLRPTSVTFSAYAQTTSLNQLSYYGIGQGASRSSLAFYGMRQTVAGGNADLPLWKKFNLSLIAEANARIVNLRSANYQGGPSIEQAYSPATAPGLSFETASFGQFGEGLRMTPSINRLAFDYMAAMQEYAAPGTNSTFSRLVLDLGHQFSLYSTSRPAAVRDFNGPNSCARSISIDTCPRPALSENLEGSIGFRFLLTDSFVPSNNAVPFYFQPTIGGSDINGNNYLPSYADYRFRAPNMMVFRETFEHSIWRLPAGFIFQADQGHVATTPSGLGSGQFVHSFAAGLTLRAGGFPVLSVMFAWGGNEGTHTISQVSNTLLGAGARPPL
jgi:hypothetical protein